MRHNGLDGIGIDNMGVALHWLMLPDRQTLQTIVKTLQTIQDISAINFPQFFLYIDARVRDKCRFILYIFSLNQRLPLLLGRPPKCPR